MIKFKNIITADVHQMMFIVEGMRNPMNSWDQSLSRIEFDSMLEGMFVLSYNDRDLMLRLSKAGTDHRKFMRMMPVYVRITAPLYWWKEFDTYKVGTVSNSCSTMHKIAEKEFTLDDFSHEHLIDTCLLEKIINELNIYRDIYNNYDAQSDEYKAEFSKKDIWWQMIQLLPSSYNQTRNVMMNYEVLANIYKSRKEHKLNEWREFCTLIEKLPYSEIIIGNTED